MTSSVGIPPALIPLVDGQGRMRIEWYLFFATVETRLGGAIGPSLSDLMASQFDDAGIEETKAALYSATDGINQSAEAASLRAEVDALRERVQALEQGLSL